MGSLLQRELAEIVRADKENFGFWLLTVTNVKVSVDIKHATVSVSVLGAIGSREAALRKLKARAGRLRYLLGSRVELRRVPELRFELDDTFDRAQRIDEILSNSGIDFSEVEEENSNE